MLPGDVHKHTQATWNLHPCCCNSVWQCSLFLPRSPALWSHGGCCLNAELFLPLSSQTCVFGVKSDLGAWERRRKPEACLMECQCLGLNYQRDNISFLSLSCTRHSASVCTPSRVPPPPFFPPKCRCFTWPQPTVRALPIINSSCTSSLSSQIDFRSYWPTVLVVAFQLNNSWELTSSQLQPARVNTWAPKCIKMMKWRDI